MQCEEAARHLTVFECDAPGPEEFGREWISTPVARLRYTKADRLWTLYWPDRNSRFNRYDFLDPSPNVADLLAEIDRDPTCIFWG